MNRKENRAHPLMDNNRGGKGEIRWDDQTLIWKRFSKDIVFDSFDYGLHILLLAIISRSTIENRIEKKLPMAVAVSRMSFV